MASFSKVYKNASLYFLSNVVQRGSSIIFFPIFTKYLTEYDYGVQSVVGNIIQFVTIIVGFELNRSLVRFLYNKNADNEDSAKLIGSIFYFSVVVSLIVVAICILLGQSLFQYFLDEIPFDPYLYVFLLAVPFVSIYNLYRIYLQATHQATKYVKVDLAFFVCNVSLNLYLVIVHDMGVMGLFYSTLVSAGIFSLYGYLTFFKDYKITINWEVIKSCLLYSVPLIPFTILGSIQGIIDSLFLNAYKGPEVTGVYFIAFMIVMMFSVLKGSFYSAFTPWFFENVEKSESSYLNKVINISYLGIGLFAMGISWFSYEALFILSNNEGLVEAWKYTPILVVGIYAVFLGQLLNLTTLYSKNRNKYLGLSTLVGVLINVGLCYVLIEPYGAYGAALASMFSFIGMTLIQGVISFKSMDFRFDYVYLIVVSLGISIAAFIQYLPLEWMQLLLLKIGLYAGVLGWFAHYVNKKYGVFKLIREKINSSDLFS